VKTRSALYRAVMLALAPQPGARAQSWDAPACGSKQLCSPMQYIDGAKRRRCRGACPRVAWAWVALSVWRG
jgi:hypothetical protein